MELALQEDIGDINARNVNNYLPSQIEHLQPYNAIPKKKIFEKNLKLAMNGCHEADYMIVCTKRNTNIILEQLRQLNLRQTTKKYTVIKKLKPSLFSKINCKKDK